MGIVRNIRTIFGRGRACVKQARASLCRGTGNVGDDHPRAGECRGLGQRLGEYGDDLRPRDGLGLRP